MWLYLRDMVGFLLDSGVIVHKRSKQELHVADGCKLWKYHVLSLHLPLPNPDIHQTYIVLCLMSVWALGFGHPHRKAIDKHQALSDNTSGSLRQSPVSLQTGARAPHSPLGGAPCQMKGKNCGSCFHSGIPTPIVASVFPTSLLKSWHVLLELTQRSK